MTIGGELYASLKRLRKADGSLRIWVDALCINQADTDERNEHVKMMGEIYSKASAVHIWLGEPMGDDGRAVRTLEVISAKFDEFKKKGHFDPLAHVDITYEFINDGDVRNLVWDALAALMSRAWVRPLFFFRGIAKDFTQTTNLGNSLSEYG